MELSDVVRRRRMVRSFSGRPGPNEVRERILAAACTGPSAGNTGGWEAVVLEGRAQTTVFWEATTTPDWRARSPRWPGLVSAPMVVAVFVHPGAYLARYAEPDKESSGLGDDIEAWPVPYWFVDGAFGALLMLLAATDAELGTCFLGNFRGEEALREALGVPADRRYLGAVLVGEPAGADSPSPSANRGPRPASVMHRARWGGTS
jgi:nitroreductase